LTNSPCPCPGMRRLRWRLGGVAAVWVCTDRVRSEILPFAELAVRIADLQERLCQKIDILCCECYAVAAACRTASSNSTPSHVPFRPSRSPFHCTVPSCRAFSKCQQHCARVSSRRPRALLCGSHACCRR
jgi:hypothetical protein